MTDLERLQRKQNQVFIVVCINFAFFMVLFSGLGYVTWQSAMLIDRLQADLVKAEETVAELRSRVQEIDTDEIVERLVSTATTQVSDSISTVIQGMDLTAPVRQVSAQLSTTQEMIEEAGAAIQGIHETVRGLDSGDLAEQVSYHMLKGLGDGFQEAAEARRPASQPDS